MQYIARDLKDMNKTLVQMQTPGIDVNINDASKSINVNAKIESVRAECKSLHRFFMELKAHYQRDRHSVMQSVCERFHVRG